MDSINPLSIRNLLNFIDVILVQAEVESRKRVVDGTFGDKKFTSFGTEDFERYKTDSLDFVKEICRGIAVNTNYSSNIQVNNK